MHRHPVRSSLAALVLFTVASLSGCSSKSNSATDAGADGGYDGAFAGSCSTNADCTVASTGSSCAGGVCGCPDNLHCPDPARPRCSLIEQGQCGPCMTDDDCTSSLGGPICKSGTCTGCTSNTDCATSVFGPICDTTTGVCGCTTSTDCAGVASGPSCITVDQGGSSGKVCGCGSPSDACLAIPSAPVCQNVLGRWGANLYVCD